ncbi:MAG: DNA-3-methyladenine glycosylase [Acidimicrobiales bacterium]
MSGRIVEVEAYAGIDDPASHAHRDRRLARRSCSGRSGGSTVPVLSACTRCANVVAHQEGEPGAVLLRAVEPLAGLDLMRLRQVQRSAETAIWAPARAG